MPWPLYPWKRTEVPTEYEAVRALEPVWTFKRKKSLALPRIWIP